MKFSKLLRKKKNKVHIGNGKSRRKSRNFVGADDGDDYVSEVHTAPVAIGNSLRGHEPKVANTKNGVRVSGRDFAFTETATSASVTGWTLVGGMPITPAVMGAVTLNSYAKMFAKFKVNKLVFHYITASPTSQTGDVMFYYERNRLGPMIDSSSVGFLPLVLSDGNTVIGPRWTNMSTTIKPKDEWNFCDYATHTDLNEDTCGSIFLFSKSSAATISGTIVMDYDISFVELCTNPRAGLYPFRRGTWTAACLYGNGLNVTAGTTAAYAAITSGNTITGTTSTLPSGCTKGEIYKVVSDMTNSTIVNTGSTGWNNCTAANLLNWETVGGSDISFTIDDGFTFYVVYNGTLFYLYPTLEAAISLTPAITFGVTNSDVDFALCCFISLVYTPNNNSQASM